MRIGLTTFSLPWPTAVSAVVDGVPEGARSERYRQLPMTGDRPTLASSLAIASKPSNRSESRYEVSWTAWNRSLDSDGQ